ncbi:MAG: LPS export ABC transporter ATP-binding protein [Leptolyngbya sp. PLA3]|nr:MAG: LPS export ABC transporter ATP-binding protein [Cyanobacteria bacterium CYA]MCE7967459.1 LPS export ABC transporter ATP-binding protein [Leptolyngbya sp. PL-A3]
MPLLEATNLRKAYAGRTVVDGVSISVEKAEIVGLLGRNGAGKTTSFRMTIGMIEADAGRVVFDGHDLTGQPMYRHARMGIGYLSQEPSVFQRLTCEQNLLAILETRKLSRKERRRRADELLARFGLTHKAKHLARTCSGGERRKLEIARSLITEPRLILLDEPFSGVDPIAVEELQNELRRLCDQGIAFLITDHNVQQTLRVCDRAYIIDAGKVLAQGTPRELINDDLVKRVYLGSLFRGDEFDEPVATGGTGVPPVGASTNRSRHP